MVLWAPDVPGHPVSSLRLWGTQKMPWSRVEDVTYCTFGPTYRTPPFRAATRGPHASALTLPSRLPWCPPMRPRPAARACRTACRGGAAVKPSKPPQPAQNTFTWSGALDASPTGHTAGVADRRYAATAASPDPPGSSTAASTCPAHCWPVWSSSGAVTVASARSNHAHGGDQKRRPKKCCDSTSQSADSEARCACP